MKAKNSQLLARGYNAGSIVEIVHVDEATLDTSTTMGVMYLTTINYTVAMVFCVNSETRYTQYGYTVGGVIRDMHRLRQGTYRGHGQRGKAIFGLRHIERK